MKYIFVIYTLLLIFFVLFKFNFTMYDLNNYIKNFREINYKRVNLEFLNSIKMQINILYRWAILNLLGNTIPFIIYGFLLKLTFNSSIYTAIFTSLFLVLLLELTQLIFVIGTFDVDDIFLNFLSILFGFLFGKYVFKNHAYTH